MIPYTVSQFKQQFRLLELPPELVESISTERAPILQLKSAPTADSSDGPITPNTKGQTNLHLVTSDRSFQVRQVNTSNSVYITEPNERRPTSTQNGGLGNADQSINAPQELQPFSAHLSAVGEVSSVLELQPVSHDVHGLLRRHLHTWSGASSLGQDREPLASSEKASIFSDIPCPDRDIARAWKDLGAIETTFTDHRACLKPSAVAARDGWKALVQGCVAEGVDLSTEMSFESTLKAYEPRLNGAEKVVEVEILSAMLECLEEPTTQGFRLSREKTVRWVGAKILQAAYEERASWTLETGNPHKIDVSAFLASWRDMLPEPWRDDAKLPALGLQRHGRYQIAEDGNSIQFWEGVGDESFLFNTSKMEESGGSELAAKTANSAVGKRKWHEKFKAARDKRAS